MLVETLSDPTLDAMSRASMEASGEKTCLSAPLYFGDEPLGILVLIETARERRFSDDDLAVLAGLSTQAAIALHHARLFERLQLRTFETEVLNEIARAAASSLKLGDIAQATVTHLRSLVAFEGSSLVQLPPDGSVSVAYSRDGAPRAGRPAPGGHRRRLPAAVAERARGRDRAGRARVPAGGADHGRRAAAGGSGGPVRRRPAVGRAHAHRARRRLPERKRPQGTGGRGRAPVAGHQERAPLRHRQAPAPGQPQGAQLGAAGQGLLHHRPHRARGHLCRAAGGRAGLVAGSGGPGRGDRLPARHRQDRRVRPGAAQDRAAHRRGVGAHAPAPGDQRRDHRAAAGRAARGRRAPPPRAVRRQRLPGRPGRR